MASNLATMCRMCGQNKTVEDMNDAGECADCQERINRRLIAVGGAGIAATKDALRNRVGALFLVADDGERKGEFWWVCYMAGVRCFASTDEVSVDNFRARLHASVLETLGLK